MSGSHAEHSPSSAHRWLRCPGSVAAVRGLPNPDSAYSREGTFAHEIAANALRDDAPIQVGATDGEFTCDETMARHLRDYVDAVRACVLTEDGQLFVEEKVHAITDVVYGTADAIVLSEDGKRLHVFDLKFGAGLLVEAEGNEQLLTYAVGALNGLGLTLAKSVQEVVLHIVQPRRSDSSGSTHRQTTVPVNDVWRHHKALVDGVAATNEANAKLVPGDYCGFCPAKAGCSALHERALKAAQEVFPALDANEPVTPPSPETFTSEQLSKLLQTADIVETWLKAVREHAADRLARGVAVPGWKLVERIGNRRWISETQAAGALQAIGVDPWAPREVISPAQAEKKLGKAKGMVAKLVERPVTGAVMVPESDKRPALNASDAAAKLFEAIPD